MKMSDPTVVLVPGGFTGGWMWSDVAAFLDREGVEVIVAELPSIGEDAIDADLYVDAQVVRELLDQLKAPVLLCGHSYGGAVITEAAAGPHPLVRHLVYLAASAPAAGQSMADVGTAAAADPGTEVEQVSFRDDGLAVLNREAARQVLFNDCAPERAEKGLDQLRPMNLSGGGQRVRGAAWTQLPTTYVRGTHDRMPEAIAEDFLETAELVELPTGHCPNWSRPDLVAELLADRAKPMST